MAGALAFVVIALRTDPTTAVLTVMRPVPAGGIIMDADLAVARIVPDPNVEVVPDAQRTSIIGRTAAVPLVAGTLLSPKQLGAVAWPKPGESVIAVGVKPGHAPAGLAVGSSVTVLVVPVDGASGGGSDDRKPVKEAAVVVSVARPEAAGTTVVSLLLSSPSGERVATASGDVSLILQGAGG